MRYQLGMLWFLCAIWTIFGIGYLAAPGFFASFVDMELTTADARIDIRALYGGMLLGIAAWWAYCALNRPLIYAGVVSAFLIVLGLFAGRTLGVAIDGSANAMNLFYVAIEGAASIAMFAAFRLGPRDAQATPG